MHWPGECSTKLLADIVIFSSYLILLISKHFIDCLSTEKSLFFRSSCILMRKVSANNAQQCQKTPNFSLFLQWSNQSKSRKGTQNNRRFQTRKWRHGGNFQRTKITCIWRQSINLKHCPFPLVNCKGEAVGEEDKTINTFSILKDCRQL